MTRSHLLPGPESSRSSATATYSSPRSAAVHANASSQADTGITMARQQDAGFARCPLPLRIRKYLPYEHKNTSNINKLLLSRGLTIDASLTGTLSASYSLRLVNQNLAS